VFKERSFLRVCQVSTILYYIYIAILVLALTINTVFIINGISNMVDEIHFYRKYCISGIVYPKIFSDGAKII